LIGLSTGGNGFMCRSNGIFNNFNKERFFKAAPWSGKLNTIVSFDRYFSKLNTIALFLWLFESAVQLFCCHTLARS